MCRLVTVKNSTVITVIIAKINPNLGTNDHYLYQEMTRLQNLNQPVRCAILCLYPDLEDKPLAFPACAFPIIFPINAAVLAMAPLVSAAAFAIALPVKAAVFAIAAPVKAAEFAIEPATKADVLPIALPIVAIVDASVDARLPIVNGVSPDIAAGGTAPDGAKRKPAKPISSAIPPPACSLL
jgi:hypothetical protein